MSDYGPTDFAQDLAEIIETRGDDTEQFKTRVKQLVRTARAHGMDETQIRAQIGAKADAMERSLEGSA